MNTATFDGEDYFAELARRTEAESQGGPFQHNSHGIAPDPLVPIYRTATDIDALDAFLTEGRCRNYTPAEIGAQLDAALYIGQRRCDEDPHHLPVLAPAQPSPVAIAGVRAW